MFVSDPNVGGFNNDFVLLGADSHLDIAVKRSEYHQVSAGDGCAEPMYLNNLLSKLFDGVSPVKLESYLGEYKRETCRELFAIWNTFLECKCIPSSAVLGHALNFVSIAAIRVAEENVRGCNFFHQRCRERVLLEEKDMENCIPACHAVEYDLTPSTVRTNATAVLLQRMTDAFRAGDPIRGREVQGEKYASVNVFYTSKDIQVFQETLVWTPYTFIGNIGGVIGLYIGMSLLSFMEVMELIIDLILYNCASNKQQAFGGVKRGRTQNQVWTTASLSAKPIEADKLAWYIEPERS